MERTGQDWTGLDKSGQDWARPGPVEGKTFWGPALINLQRLKRYTTYHNIDSGMAPPVPPALKTEQDKIRKKSKVWANLSNFGQFLEVSTFLNKFGQV